MIVVVCLYMFEIFGIKSIIKPHRPLTAFILMICYPIPSTRDKSILMLVDEKILKTIFSVHLPFPWINSNKL